MSKNFLRTSFIATLLASSFVLSPLPSHAKRWTVTERLERLSKAVDKGRTANELTIKQVDSLKGEIKSIKEKAEKMKTKNNGKLSLPDTRKLHKEVNELSVQILRDRLDNVYN